MIRDVSRKYFEVWGNEEAQNTMLKGLLIILSALFAVQSVVLGIVAMRKPVLVAVGQGETRVFTMTPPSEQLLSDELKRLVRRYAQVHYTWDNTSVENAHIEASRYVSAQFIKAFNAANAEQVKIAKEKKLAQKVYVADVTVDSKVLSARVTMDRILMIEDLRAVSQLVLDITFEYGPRTTTNPEGVYVTGEKVVTPQIGG